MSRSRRARVPVALLALAALSLWEIATLLAVERSAPRDEDWRRASAAVRDGFVPGDLVVFAPEWLDPVGRHWLGDLIRIEDAARMDDARYARVWEVSIRGAGAPEFADATPEDARQFGAVRVRRFERPAPLVTWDTRRSARLLEVAFRPRQCVLLQVRTPEDVARVAFRGVVLGTTLHVSAGLADSRARRDNRATARLEVRVDGRSVTGAVLDERRGWHPLPAAPTVPGRHDVEFRARVDRWREPVRLDLCVAAESRRAS